MLANNLIYLPMVAALLLLLLFASRTADASSKTGSFSTKDPTTTTKSSSFWGRPSSSSSSFTSKRTPGNVEIVNLHGTTTTTTTTATESYPEELYKEWQATFPSPHHPLHKLDSHKNPAETNELVTQAFCFCLLQGQQYGFLPPTLISKLQKLPYDPNAPCALVIRGLPLDRNVPPSPIVDSNSRINRIQPSLCPLAETILLGIARILGIPHGAPTPIHSNIIRDLSSERREVDDTPLKMHRDFPRRTLDLIWEPEFLVMMSVRAGQVGAKASTTVTDTRRLYSKLSKADKDLLIRYKIQITTQKEGKVIGKPYHAIELDYDNNDDGGDTIPKLNVFQTSNCYASCPEALTAAAPNGGVELERRVLRAHERLCQIAEDLKEEIPLQPGDMLILNNALCVHGRTPLNNNFDGTDRWLIKTYVSNGLWKKPGQINSSDEPSAFPNFDFPTN